MGLDAVAWVNFPSGGHASETAEPQQDSGPTGCHWASRAGAVWAPSNPLKAKVDGWGWTHASETAEQQRWVGGAGRCRLGCSCQRKQRWVGGAGRCRLGCSCQRCCTSFAKAASRWPPCRMNVLSRPSFGFVLPARLPLELRRGVGGLITRWWQLKDFLEFSENWGKDLFFDEHIFSDGWFNHQPPLFGERTNLTNIFQMG